MDKIMKELIELAYKRESMYVKGDFNIEELPQKTAELGAFLLASSKRLTNLKGEDLRSELNILQNKVDDFRKSIFQKKADKL